MVKTKTYFTIACHLQANGMMGHLNRVVKALSNLNRTVPSGLATLNATDTY